MKIKLERLADCVREVDKLILGYYADTNAQEGIPPLKMNWEFFIKLEAIEKLLLFTARVEGELVGVNMYMLSEHPQHGGMPCAICNTLAVATRYRGQGIGTRLAKEGLAFFGKRPEKWMVVHYSRAIYDVEPLFPKLGFALAERGYMKVV